MRAAARMELNVPATTHSAFGKFFAGAILVIAIAALVWWLQPASDSGQDAQTDLSEIAASADHSTKMNHYRSGRNLPTLGVNAVSQDAEEAPNKQSDDVVADGLQNANRPNEISDGTATKSGFLKQWQATRVTPGWGWDSLQADNSMRQALSAARMQRFPLFASGSDAYLDFHLEPWRRCSYGDLDIMRRELQRQGRAHLVATIEAFDTSSFLPQSRAITVAQIEQGYDLLFTVPRPAQPTLAGLFFCTDSKAEQTCQNKESVDLDLLIKEQLSAEALKNAGVPSKDPPPDRILFFQPLLLTEDSALALSEGWDATDLDPALQEVLMAATKSAEKGRGHAQRLLKLARLTKSEVLQSASGGNRIEIRMPVYDATTCDAL